MAARNPSDYTRWVNKTIIVPGDPILASTLDSILDDQEYACDAEMLVISDCFAPFSKSDNTYATVGTYYIESRDVCDVAGASHNHAFSCYCWSASAATGTVQVSTTIGGGDSSNPPTSYVADSQTVTFTNAAPAWTAFAEVDVGTNGDEETIKIEIKNDGSANAVYIAGFFMVATEL